MSEGAPAATFRILAGVAYDETGESALQMAIELARFRPRAMLHVAHALSTSALSNRASRIDEHARILEGHPRTLAELTERFLPAEGPRPEVAVHVRVGDAASVLLQLALDYDVDLLVVGTHGRRGLERLALGSVAQSLLGARRCPVVIAMPPHFEGMRKTVLPTPECTDCASLRTKTAGRELWCPIHARMHVATSLRLRDGAWEPMGGLDPGLVA